MTSSHSQILRGEDAPKTTVEAFRTLISEFFRVEKNVSKIDSCTQKHIDIKGECFEKQ